MIYDDHPTLCVPTMPGAWRQKRGGFLYALMAGRIVKIGASTNPRVRIREQCFDGFLSVWDLRFRRFVVRRIFLSDQLDQFRIIEKKIHLILCAFRVGRAREIYQLPSSQFASALEKLFETNFSEAALEALCDLTRSRLNGTRQRTCSVINGKAVAHA